MCYRRQNMFLLCILVFNLVFTCNGDEDFLCTADFCSQQLEDEECEDTIPQGCEYKGMMLNSPTPCNCCQYCIGYLDEGAKCELGAATLDTVKNICGPGLTCEEETCVKITDKDCVQKQKNYDDSDSFQQISWRPVCDGEGDFGPVHCIPNSICYCIEPDYGTRIFGEAIYSADAVQDMSCACALAAWRASKLGERTEFFRCLSDGQYDALQCVDGECVCVHQTTGTPIGTTSVHTSELDEGALPCFNEEIHPVGRFEKSCELKYKNIRDEMTEWELEGMQVLNVELPNCTPDGYYHRVQPSRNKDGFKCVDPEGNLIGSYESDAGVSDCNCAYTSWLMSKAGLQELPTCKDDGSFESTQCFRDRCYCVDSNGDQVDDHVGFSEPLNCEDT